MSIPPNITRRALLNLTGPLMLLPLAGCSIAGADPQDDPGSQDSTKTPDTNDTQEGSVVVAPPADRLLVPSDHSPIAADAAWCAPFQICWDLLIDDFNCGEPIPEDGQPSTVADLNSASFEADYVGEDHYVTYVGKATTQAKSEIEQLIDERFDQTSDILDELVWEDDPNTLLYIIYCMLYREFTFKTTFDNLDPAPFGSEEGGNYVESVEYFGTDGIKEEADTLLRDQITPLYWESEDRFAVQINCMDGDMVSDVLVLARGAQGSTIDELWSDVKASKDANTDYIEVRSFACPKLNVDIKTEYSELETVSFTNPNGDPIEIKKALQTLKFKLDETGGTIKSEAAIQFLYGSADIAELHDFRFDDSFALLLFDASVWGLKYPYAALKITNIKDFL